MSQSLWESEAAENAQPEEHVVEAAAESAVESVNLVKRERLTRAAAEERANAAEAQLREQMPIAENLQKEVGALHAEREHVRQRVERLLSQLDALEL
jgi:hypothetical protein